MSYIWFWLIVFIVLLVCEIATSSLISIWFCGGALFSILTNITGFSFLVQLIVFVFGSSLLLVLTRPFAKKILKREPLKTNVSTLIGKKAVVTKQINNNLSSGEITINGQVWSAKNIVENEIIEECSNVIIEDIRGVKAVVKSI